MLQSKSNIGSIEERSKDMLKHMESATRSENVSKCTKEYRTKISRCVPIDARDILLKSDACFLGVSLENKNFSYQKIRSMLNWIDGKCARAAILIGDGIHRKTLQITMGLEEEEARERALELGGDYSRRINEILQSRYFKCDFQIVLCSQIQKSISYSRYLKVVRDEFDADRDFRESVHSFSALYIEKKGLRADFKNSMESIQNLSVDYFLEEFAIFACLVECGYPVMLYPGSFSSLESIVADKNSYLGEISPKALFSLNLRRR